MRWGQLPIWRHWGPRRRSRPQGRQGRGTQPPAEPSSYNQICEDFRSISRKIYEKPNSIEELADIREWMKGIPEKLVGLEVRHAYKGCVWGEVSRSLVGWRSGGHTGDWESRGHCSGSGGWRQAGAGRSGARRLEVR